MPRRNLILMVAGLVLLTGCSEPVSHAFTTQTTPTQAPAPTTTAPVAAAQAPGVEEPIVITGAGYDLHTAGRVGQAAFDAAWAGVLQTLNQYLEEAVLKPLRTGGPAGDLTPLFTPLSVAEVMTAGADRAAFIDEGLAPATDLRKNAAVARLTALAGADGAMSVITAVLDLRLSGRVDGAPMFVERAGELVLVPDGGTWRIDAWDLRVIRRLAQTTTTTEASS
ncbi:MAG TPA: hypothetical protein VHF27_00500 [Acidimicrobiales bacterium]|nr:hypothetical protein [Acidimicrobiales bacterium]